MAHKSDRFLLFATIAN